jgi:hypothetical protein
MATATPYAATTLITLASRRAAWSGPGFVQTRSSVEELRRSRGETCANGCKDLASGRNGTQHHEGLGSAVYYGVTVDQDLVFAVTSVHGVYVNTEFSPEFRRHTDGVEPGQSVLAIANDYSRHGTSSCVNAEKGMAAWN